MRHSKDGARRARKASLLFLELIAPSRLAGRSRRAQQVSHCVKSCESRTDNLPLLGGGQDSLIARGRALPAS